MAQGKQSSFSDEDIMAFADGQCDAVLHDSITIAARSDKALAARIEMFRQTSAMLKSAFSPVADRQADDQLAAMIRNSGVAPAAAPSASSNVVQFPGARKPKPMATWQQAIAASVMLAIGLAGGYLLGAPTPDGPASTLALAPAVETVLASVVSGQARRVGQDEVTIIASFKDQQGNICREFEVSSRGGDQSISVACNKNQTWKLVFQAAKPNAADIFVPAGGELALEKFLEAAGFTEPLSAETEMQFLKKP